MDLRLSGVRYPIVALGPGQRVGIWFQGCTIGCPGCMSRDTWDPNGGATIDTKDLVHIVLAAQVEEGLSGVTISGGEPFQQPDALHALCTELRHVWSDADLLVYSGYSFARLRRDFPEILGIIDAVIAGPFVEAQPTSLPWRGSSNQTLTLLSQRARSRFAKTDAQLQPHLQVAVEEAGLSVVGIPRRGDLDRLRNRLHEEGIVLKETSWKL